MNAVVFLLLLLFAPLMLRPGANNGNGTDLIFIAVFGALLLGGFAYAHKMVFGFATSQGIRYKRYFRWKYVKWDEIESITKSSMGTICIDVAHFSAFNRRLVFVKEIILFGKRGEFATFERIRSEWAQSIGGVV